MKNKHRCPVCGHDIPVGTAGNFYSHGMDGTIRRHASRLNQSDFCRGSIYRVRNGAVLDAENKLVAEPEPKKKKSK